MTIQGHARTTIAIIVASILLWFAPGSQAAAANPQSAGQGCTITKVSFETLADSYLLRIRGESPPTYTLYEMVNPLRVVVNIADAHFADTVALPMEVNQGPIARISGQLLDKQEPYIAQLEVQLAADHKYTVSRQDNDILISFNRQPAAGPHEGEIAALAGSRQRSNATRAYGLKIAKNAQESIVQIVADGPINDYEKVVLAKDSKRPDRIYLDLNGITAPTLPVSREVGGALARVRTSRRDHGIRVVFDSGLSTLFDYTITPVADGLTVAIRQPGCPTSSERSPAVAKIIADLVQEGNEPAAQAAAPALAAGEPRELVVPAIPATKYLPAPAAESKPTPAPSPAASRHRPPPADSTPAAKTASGSPLEGNDFKAAGYTKQKITVDFFKIDLHNVFRLIGEISGTNMVVDEEVKGSLTLALNDIPWDFALDIILNLKDLRKEERFNTIVISPKSKAFSWPEPPKKEEQLHQEPAIAITNKVEVSQELSEAKNIVHQAQSKENEGDYKGAVHLYEVAFEKWPTNGALAKRIGALCLTELGLNTKAIHWAQIALQLDPKDYEAALQAAIGLANMHNIEAKEYFDQAISGPRPAKEALLSYAAFAEEKESYHGAIQLLSKYAELYGPSLETMVARARIFDKAGQGQQAAAEYQALLLSGYTLEPDLEHYIKGRLALENK